jgi:carbamoyltransferase
VFFHSAVAELRRRLPQDFAREDLAASIQKHTERLATEFARHWIGVTGKRDVALAGGLFGNVRINQEIHELDAVDRCFVHPGMSDAGMGVGAALAAYYDRSPRPALNTRCLDHVYLGPSFGAGEIEVALAGRGLDVSFPDDLEAEVAGLLAEGAVVARFDGRMEYGPRALGNRSILYRPDDPSVNDWLNAALKRTEFMPFAPAVREEDASRCFHHMEGAERTSRFMTITFYCTDLMRKRCPGTVHIDGTARPQVVRSEDNPSFHRIIERYGELTGTPAIINTSFNMHEEPIVCSPDDAVRAFVSSQLDYLAIGPYLARNPAQKRDELRADRGDSAGAVQREVVRSRTQPALPSD